MSVLAGAAVVTMAVASAALATLPSRSGRVAVPLANGDPGPADLQLTGSVNPTQAGVGDSLTWQLTVNDYNTGPALAVWVDVTLPSNVQLVSSYTDRGTGCTSTGATTLHCYLDWLSKGAQFGHVILVTKIAGTGDHTLTAVTGYSSPSGPVADPTPANNTTTVTATTPSPPPAPVIGPAAIVSLPAAGKPFTVTFPVTRSDNGAPLTEGTITAQVSVAGKAIKNSAQFTNGVAQVSLTVPKTAKRKRLKVQVTIQSTGGSGTRAASYPVH